MTQSIYLGKIARIKIFIHWTFVVLVAWLVAINVLEGARWDKALISLLLLVGVFGSVVLHELGHSLVARRFGISTHHITLLPIGGVARMEYISEKPRDELAIALAGPAVNLVLAAAGVAIFRLWHPSANFPSVGELTLSDAGDLLPLLVVTNASLALFNLIPAFPMDGGRVLRALLALRLGHAKATRRAAYIGQWLAMVFVFAGLLGNPFLIFIGIFVFIGAQAEAQATEARYILKDHTLADVLMHDIPTLDEHASIKEAASRLLTSQNKNFLVTKEGKPLGTISRENIITALKNHQEGEAVFSIVDKPLESLPIDTPLDKAWMRMREDRRPMVLIESEGQLRGAVDEESIEELILIETAKATPAH